MTAEPDLLPLPEVKLDGFTTHDMHDYARANVAHAVAPLQAEIEALRAEVESERRLRIREEGLSRAWKARADFAEAGLNTCAGRAARAEARAERLAEALRVAVLALAHASECDAKYFPAYQHVSAALEQEAGRG